ncbi:MAG: RNB domain-containing ribonuclease [Chloroflexi bacterium]|nr:MAG: RNB domain-containing ribonuclease [Chloroflexota bacterium]
MTQPSLPQQALVLYKNRPAIIIQAGSKKITISLDDGQTVNVRPKDVTLLHPGPLAQLADLTPLDEGEILTAWELLAGETVTLAELAELAYGEFTPQTAWNAWQYVADGLYFQGTPEQIVAQSAEAVAREQEARAAKEAEKQAWAEFLTRVERGEWLPEDGRYLQDVVALALEQHTGSRLLRALGRAETPQNAHALLLESGFWDVTVNPYPRRLGLPTDVPQLPVSNLPDEPRRDLTHLPAYAIDDEDSRDPDDALSWENGRLWVHIADVAALVPPGTPADEEARGRGANIYLPEGTIPMLPLGVTEKLGLGLQEISPALSFGLDVSPAGEITHVEITPSWVRVTRMSYTQAETELETNPVLAALYELTSRFEARRRQQGAVMINLPEVKVRVVDGEVVIRPLPNLRSRDLVREAMLMVGEAVARFAWQHKLPIPYTVQEPPQNPPALNGNTWSAMFALRRTLSPSQQSTMPGLHAGLGLEMYVQATSPLRRYLDLVVHQQLRAFLSGRPPLDEGELMLRVGAADAVRGDVRLAERLSNEHWTLVYLLQHPDWQGEGVIVDRRGAYDVVLIPALGMETLVYRQEERPLDTTITLAVQSVNLPERVAHFQEIHPNQVA